MISRSSYENKCNVNIFCIIVARHTLGPSAAARNGIVSDSHTDTNLGPVQQLKMEVLHNTVGKKLLICSQMCLSNRFKNYVSDYHTDKGFMLSLQDTQFGHKQHFKMEDQLFTSL